MGDRQQGPLAPWQPAGGLGGRHLQGQEGLTSPTALSEAAGPPQGPLEPPAQTHLALQHLSRGWAWGQGRSPLSQGDVTHGGSSEGQSAGGRALRQGHLFT